MNTVVGIGALVALSALAFILLDYVDGWRKKRALAGIPIIDDGSYLSPLFRWSGSAFNHGEEYQRAYEKYSKAGKPFAAKQQHGGYGIVLPPESCKEWRFLGNEQLSFGHALSEVADLYQHMNVIDRTPVEAVNSCNKAAVLENMQELVGAETDKQLAVLFGDESRGEWTSTNIFQCTNTLLAAVATSMILGHGSSQMTDLALAHNMSLFPSLILRRRTPALFQQLVWRFAGPCRNMRLRLALLREFLAPEIERRIHLHRELGQSETTTFSLLDALIKATIASGSLSGDARKAIDKATIDLLVQQTALFHFQLCTPTGVNLASMLHRLVDNPEYIGPMRDEISKALATCPGESQGPGGGRGQWKGDVLSHSPKLESFCKESFRLDDISLFVNVRRVMHPLTITTLTPPLHLTPGTYIMTPSRSIHHDPAVYADPETFDGYRFYNKDSNSCVPRVSTSSPTFLSWAHGTGRCPARNFASQVPRLIVARILLAFEVRAEGGSAGWGGGYGAPEAGVDGMVFIPNRHVCMEVRRRG